MGLEAELSAKQALVLTAGRARVEAGLRLCQAMQDGAFGDKVRSTALVGRHGGDLNEAVRRVLSRFALHYYVRQNLTTELNEDRGICFRLGDGRTHKSLSTGQRNALAISLAVVFSLNRTNSPLGFVCLDDVSSAFDLDNLASDAAIVRTLAYNRDKRHQRQVILATHHDELTTRLMPVLRPPKDRRLKVVEFVDWSRSRGSVVKQWECMPGTGDPAEVLELWEERRRPRSPQNRERTV
ncbi:MAG: hypothetical protein KKI08_18025 [Armatimonadetes bacterium]|nr:hypothetical protein [Armatimonadota bacterium]